MAADSSTELPSDLMNLDIVASTLRPNCLHGRRAFVTGAIPNAIGYATALVLSKICGAELAVHSESERLLAQTIESLHDEGVDAQGFVSDFRDLESVKQLANNVQAHYGDPDILVNVAGLSISVDYLALTDEQFAELFSINVTAGHLLAQAFIPAMLRRGRSNIIGFSSTHAYRVGSNHIAYAMTKAAVRTWIAGLAVRFGPQGLRAHCLSPGAVKVARQYEEPFFSRMKYEEQVVPERRIASPVEIGGIVAFLCTDLASYANGSDIVVDGGSLK